MVSLRFIGNRNKSQGFTLVELLVVISIIAILSVIGLTVYSGTQAKARDAKRRADVNAISNALEANYNESDATYNNIDGVWFASGTIPTDPKGGDYIGVSSVKSVTTSWRICADLELVSSWDGTQLDYCRSSSR